MSSGRTLLRYIGKRLLMTLPTLFGITILVFVIINLAPGSPIEQKLQEIQFGGGSRASQGISPQVREALIRQYGFDQPLLTRYGIWLKKVVTLDFGKSFTYEEDVLSVIASKFPVSLSFGLVSFVLTYLICIPLGIGMAIHEGKPLDIFASSALFVAYSIPPFMFGILLIVFFAGGSFLDWFPIGYLVSDHYDQLSLGGKIWDRIHHFILPLTCYMLSHFTTLTLLMRNSILDEIRKDYIRTARAKGLDERGVYLRHALRNALIPVATGVGQFLGVFFAGSLLLETIFQLDGIGLLSYKSVLQRDYNVIMGLVLIESGLFLIGNLISDVIYVFVDPRIDFSGGAGGA